jgi:phasin family protein
LMRCATANRWTRAMTQQFGKHVFDQASKLFKDAVVQKNLQALSENAVAASKGFCDQATAAGLEQTKVLTKIADSAWGSTKMLNEKVAQNVISNIEATFAAAQLMAGAKSLQEIVKLQSDYIQKLTAQATEQTKEFIDLSTRASQHVFEKAHAATSKTFKATL